MSDQPLPRASLTAATAIVTPNEVNEQHGIGALLSRIFAGEPNVLSFRSHDTFGGVQSFGARCLRVSHTGLARWESCARLLHALQGSTIRRILCVPFFADDLITASALSDLYRAPLCIYVMDDNNVGGRGIPDDLFDEALGKARLRLGISPEICAAYAAKYARPFHLLPPLVDPALVSSTPPQPDAALLASATGVLLGNVWSQRWLDRLRATLKASGLAVDWFGHSGASWLHYSDEALAADGIFRRGFLAEAELLRKLRAYPFAIIPSGSLDDHDDRPELARLSLPSRIPYLMATANLPLIVLGSPQTAAGRFVSRFGVGEVCPYHGPSLRAAAEDLCRLDRQTEIRRLAAQSAPLFCLDQPAAWIWQSLALGRPVDSRFEGLL